MSPPSPSRLQDPNEWVHWLTLHGLPDTASPVRWLLVLLLDTWCSISFILVLCGVQVVENRRCSVSSRWGSCSWRNVYTPRVNSCRLNLMAQFHWLFQLWVWVFSSKRLHLLIIFMSYFVISFPCTAWQWGGVWLDCLAFCRGRAPKQGGSEDLFHFFGSWS